MNNIVPYPATAAALTVRQLAAKHPAFSEPSLRWLIFNRSRNGFDACVIRIGRRVLVDEAAFLGWLVSRREAAG
jgi:hypothetical protein